MSTAMRLTPFVHWAQTINQITLKVDLNNCEDPKIEFTSKNLTFNGYGLGARGVNDYSFTLNFYGFINAQDSTYKVYDSRIEIVLSKFDGGWWPRLIATPQKPIWLKIDFDRWRSEDDTLDDEEPRDVLEDYSSAYKKLQKEEYGYIKESSKKVYLIFYNLAQFIGYFYITIVMSVLYYRDGPDSMSKTYESVANAMKFCQLIQYLEVLHPIFGYTKGSALLPFAQVTGRNFVLFIMIDLEERMQSKPVVFYLFFIWSFVEIFRYPYYITQIVKFDIGFLTWIRYTIWIPLYPMGILCESIVILRNIPYFEETKRLTVELPNKWNFAFDMLLFMKLYLLVLVLPGMYFIMTHMSKSRSRKLCSDWRLKND